MNLFHTGSWGTPELGVTEAAQRILGNTFLYQPQTSSQGGSNIFGGSGNIVSPVSGTVQGIQSNSGGRSGPVYTSNNIEDFSTPGTGSSGSNTVSTNSTNVQQGSSGPSYEDTMRNQINSGWDSYINQLNDMLNVGLPGQRSAQENIANESYTSGVNQLGTQKTSSEQAVAKQQAASLKDLASNVQNLFQSGNIYLGSRGAGDSSAANQYSYAVTKMGSKARGDIMSQANDRLNQIGDIYNSEVNRLESEKNIQLNQIASWFNDAQNSVRSQIGQAGLGRSQDLQALSTNIYNQALQAVQNLQAQTANRRAALEQWAANNSTSIQGLISNMQAVQQLPEFQGIQGGMPSVTPEGSFNIPAGYGGTDTRKRDIFGNIIG